MKNHSGSLQTAVGGEDELPPLLNAKQVAKLLCVSIRSVWRMESAREIPGSIRLRGCTRWIRDEILNWIRRRCQPDADIQ